MATTTKTTKKNTTPRIHKKWMNFEIDPATIKPVEFSWSLASGRKVVRLYDSPEKPKDDVLYANIRNYILSYYFVLDKKNKRIFCYPVQLVGHNTRKGCETAHYEPIDTKIIYMFDENKQIWEIPKESYQRYVRYDYTQRQAIYETIEAKPRKVSRLSTYYYKAQCQLTMHVKNMFAELYGSDFVYQNKSVTDSDIKSNNWIWVYWLQTKGRKYSDKTVQAVDELMNKFSSERRSDTETSSHSNSYSNVTLETNNGITALCYFSNGKETFRQVLNEKTGKLENFIWKNDKWQKSSKLSGWLQINMMTIQPSYIKTHEYDYKFLEEAVKHFNKNDGQRDYWYSPKKNVYDFVLNYMSKPVIHQLLQVQNKSSREAMYKHRGDISQIYGKIPNRGKTMFAKLGINKYQFDHSDVIVYMKWLLDSNNIAHVDNQTWDRCSEAFADLRPNSYSDEEIIKFLKAHNEFTIDRWIKINKLNNIHAGNTGYYRQEPVKQLYKDYYNSLGTMSEFGVDISAYPLLFNDKQQLQRYHDEAARAVSSVRNKAQDEKFEILYEKRQKMLENDGKYLIDMPKCSADLTLEGSHLHHCVGGYVSQVANGNTAIYFLRQASEPNTPWLTVEVRNKSCVQIHGSCNAWMGSKDEYFDAVPFLVWWFEKHDISCNDNLLTNKATGYGSIGDRRSMPTQAIAAYKALKKVSKSKIS